MSTEITKTQPAPAAAQSLDGAVRFAQLLSDADLLPRQFVGKPANVLYAIEYGRTLGITPVAAITGIHVIEGKPSASSGLIGGLVRQAGHKLRVKSDGMSTATAQIIRADDPDFTYECTWTLERAAQAGLCKLVNGKPVARDYKDRPTSWEKYSAAMLKARAITEVARDACEDVLFGLHYTPEELGAIVNQDGEPVDAEVQQLRRVESGTADPWQTPAPQQGAEERDFVTEAREATDAEKVRKIYREASAAGLDETRLGHIAAVGKSLAAGPPPPKPDPAEAADGEVVEGEVVSEEEQAARAAEAELREFADGEGLDDIAKDFEAAAGMPLSQAIAPQIHTFLGQLRGDTAA